MNTRPLRTHALQNPRTQGERIRYARLHLDISQDELARRVRQTGGGKVSKSLVSQWERDSVKNPNNANLLAIAAVTGFTPTWLIHGKEPKRQTVASRGEVAGIDVDRLTRAIAAAKSALDADALMPSRAARVIAALYETLMDAPGLDDSTLATFAATLARQ